MREAVQSVREREGREPTHDELRAALEGTGTASGSGSHAALGLPSATAGQGLVLFLREVVLLVAKEVKAWFFSYGKLFFW